MQTRRTLLVLALILVLAGIFASEFFGKGKTQAVTTTKVVMLPNLAVKPLVLKSALAVAAPQAAPVTPSDAPPAQFTPEDKAWVDRQLRAMERVAPMIKNINQQFQDSAPDDATRARMEKSDANMMAQEQKQADQLRHATPPTDLGEIPVAGLPEAPGMSVPPNAPKFTLPGGESFTVTLFYTNYWSLLITEEIPGQTGRFAGQHFQQLAIGQPMILMMHDGALAKFTLQGTMPDAPVNNNTGVGFSGQGARMGRAPATAGNN